MSLKIRLSRGGTKKRPHYRVVVADARAPRDGRFIENIGTYNPLLPKDHSDRIILKEERVKHWLSVGALPTDRVHRFLDAAGILKREPRNNPKKALPGKKRQEREAEAKAAEEEAKAAAEEEAKSGEEAPAEEEAKSSEEVPAEEAPAEESAPAEEEAPAAEAAEESAPADEEASGEEASGEEKESASE